MFHLAPLLALHALRAPQPPAIAFPPGFIWGTATAAVQVEGDTKNSDWETFERRPGAIKDGQRIGHAAKAWELYREDYKQAAAMHTNGYRFSLEWSRLVPRPGVWDEKAAEHYRAMLECLHADGIRPMVTLHHFSNPQWVDAQGGWQNPKTIDDYCWFVRHCAAAYGDLVDDWITINEPTIYASEGYVAGEFPPGLKGGWGVLPDVLANLVKAHGRAARILHQVDTRSAEPGLPPCQVGVAEHILDFEPINAWDPFDCLITGICRQMTDFDFLDAVTSGKIRIDTFWGRHIEDVPGLAHSLDFVGVNYYTRWRVSTFSPLTRQIDPGCPTTDLGLEIYPDGMTRVLKTVYARYHLPLYVTETGIADASRTKTPRFMVRYLSHIGEAIREGVPVRGVFWWSLLDNFEWQNGIEGGRFGLLAVDFNSPKRTRSWTPAAHIYARIAAHDAIPSDLLARYGDVRVKVGAAD